MKSPILLDVNTNKIIEINKPIFRIGREESNVDYTIDNTMVSRVHCDIIAKDGAYYIVDKNSTNSTYMNGFRLDSYQEYPLQACSVLQLAGTPLLFLFSESEEQ